VCAHLLMYDFSFSHKVYYTGHTFGGQVYDWGFPVLQYAKLTSQVLVGWGYGCTDNNCEEKGSKSGVFVAPVSDATIYIDYNNDGEIDYERNLTYLHSAILYDPNDDDMSGALIFATKQGSGRNGTQVKIAAAWGQNPPGVGMSAKQQRISLDLGTLVPPLPTIDVVKRVDLFIDNDCDGKISPGDVLKYTIRISNIGQVDIAAGLLTIIDDRLDNQTTYVEGTTDYMPGLSVNANQVIHIADDDTPGGTPFPLDSSGITNQASIPKRGGVHLIEFQAAVAGKAKLVRGEVCNAGVLKQSGFEDRVFKVCVPIIIPSTPSPTTVPTASPTPVPTVTPGSPTVEPTLAPTPDPSNSPSETPTGTPTTLPPSLSPSESPTSIPTQPPSISLSSNFPSESPIVKPRPGPPLSPLSYTGAPSGSPSLPSPTGKPSVCVVSLYSTNSSSSTRVCSQLFLFPPASL
jgi:uncharacterized repeat protein (TIGR01451 family)